MSSQLFSCYHAHLQRRSLHHSLNQLLLLVRPHVLQQSAFNDDRHEIMRVGDVLANNLSKGLRIEPARIWPTAEATRSHAKGPLQFSESAAATSVLDVGSLVPSPPRTAT